MQLKSSIKKLLFFSLIIYAYTISYAQDIVMQDGTFTQCTGTFYDSGGAQGDYNPALLKGQTITICPNATKRQLTVLEFIEFNTEADKDILKIYDGNSTNAPLIGSYSGTDSPGIVKATESNASGCLTLNFSTDPAQRNTGWRANISCEIPCQTITANIDKTTPDAFGGTVTVIPGEIIDFYGSATFSEDNSEANYFWDFGNGSSASGTYTFYGFPNPGTYEVTFTASDNNPQGCFGEDTITVVVKDNNVCAGALPICSGISNIPAEVGFGNAETGINYECLLEQPKPRWYYFLTGNTPGNLHFTLYQFAGPNNSGKEIDIDFIVWGPFDEPVCGNQSLKPSTSVDCSFSRDGIEHIDIINAPPNSYYMLLLTNFSEKSGFLNLQLDDNSTTETNCNIICEINLGEDFEICKGETFNIRPETSGTFRTFKWFFNGTLLEDETNFKLSRRVEESGVYTLQATGTDAVFGEPCQATDSVKITLKEEDSSFFMTATCNSAYATVTGATGGTFSFNPKPKDNAAINPDTGEISNATPGKTYTVQYTVIGECETISTQDVTIFPEITSIDTYLICEANTNGKAEFNLDDITATLLENQDASNFKITYHLTKTDAENNSNSLNSPYENNNNPEKIFAKIISIEEDCEAVLDFFLEVQEKAVANQNMPEYVLCDDNYNADEQPEDYSTEFDLSTQDTNALNGQDPSMYTVSYHPTRQDAETGNNPFPKFYKNKQNPQTVYIRVDNLGASDDSCYDISELILQVNALPPFNLDEYYVVCERTNGSETIETPPTINTYLTKPDYNFVWSYNNNTLSNETNGKIIAEQPGTYSVTVTNNNTGCELSDSTEVVLSSPPILTATLISETFSDNNVVEVTVTGIISGLGGFEFSLDNGPWQDETTFYNVGIGEHIIRGRDKLGCGITIISIKIIDYPRYFTPNNDGYHDRWNIYGLDDTYQANILIFNRHGKLIKQLNPTGSGWDGTFNGNPLPTDDYWFIVEYLDPNDNLRKHFKAHFTLKR